ncbi:LysR family transcriptional regulator [Francisella sp. 19X1-34]|uniref:LysR family transcriptional regulator n=1 Tax=Francisella sp. 19X1-34 TaxID=3087177 RepID=UPI002E34631F|nr:LysR family transcriptional regulator [Francisella sp. 19X1-34]MED7787788.1 LysR family transcriptional regulator [Francisella sp. 19X1-34]
MDFLHYKIFDKLAKNLNFRKTAKELNLSISIISKKIKELEEHYNIKLFYRTTRSVILTEAGANILPRVKDLILIGEQIGCDIRDNEEFVGNLKIGVPFTYFQSILGKVKAYTRNKTSTYIDWRIGNHLANIYSNNFDAIIFCGSLPKGDFYAKRISKWKKRVCLSPEFINMYGEPKTPEDLRKLPCLDHSDNYEESWILDKKYSIKLLQKCSSSSLLAQMAINSLGITYLPSFTVDNYIQDGLLIEVLSEYTTKDYDVYLISKTPFSQNKKAQEIYRIIS